MATVVRQPADETADTGLQTTGGTFEDTASGGFPARIAPNVTITVTGSTTANADSGTGTASSFCTIRYTTDGGTLWTNIDAFTAEAVSSAGSPGGGAFASVSGTFTVNVGDVTDMSDIDVQARVFILLVGDGFGDGHTIITDWEITTTVNIGILGE